MLRPCISGLVAALAASLLASSSHALRSQDDGDAVAPPFVASRLAPRVDWKTPQRAAAWARFVAASPRPTSWRALWDLDTGEPKSVFGGFFDAPGAVASPQAAEAHARAFVARFSDLVAPGVDAADLELDANDLDHGHRTVILRQIVRVGGARVPVLGARVTVEFKRDRLFLFGSSAQRVPASSAPRASSAAATLAAKTWAGGDLVSSPTLVVHRIVRRGGVDARLAWRVDLGAFVVFVDAATARPIARSSTRRHADARLVFDVPVRGPQAARKTYPAPLLDVTVEGAPAVTDDAGAITWSGAAAATVTTGVSGALVNVTNGAGDEAMEALPLVSGDVVWSHPEDEFTDAQLATFIHAGLVQARARGIAPDMSWLTTTVRVVPNVFDPVGCDAFWDGVKLNFYQANSVCVNAGLVADVVYHEFGHGFHQHAFLGGGFGMPGIDPALGEGTADYMAVTTTGDPALAPGFFQGQPDTPLRQIDSGKRYPDDVDPDPHMTGLIWVGAMWDLRKALAAQSGDAGIAVSDALYYGAIKRATDIPSTYAEVLAADDDDGDLGNGTPHICEINAAFAAHGLSGTLDASGLELAHAELGRVPAGTTPYVVHVDATHLYPSCVTSGEDAVVQVHYAINGASPTTVPMVRSGDAYDVVIPAFPAGFKLSYHIEGSVGAASVRLPENRADPEFTVFIGPYREIACFDFEAGAQGFTFDGPASGGFEVGAPTGAGGDPDAAFAGKNVLGTVLGGTGLYAPLATVTATSPVVDIGDAHDVHLQFRRWLNVEDGFFDQATIKVGDTIVFRNVGTSDADGSLDFTDSTWRFADVDLSDVASSKLQFGFGVTSDGGKQFGGWNVDEVCVVAIDPVVTGEGGGGAGGRKHAGDGDPAPDPGGCSCDAAGTAPTSCASALLFLAAALGTSRRRCRV